MARDFTWSTIESTLYFLHHAKALGLDAVRTMKSDVDLPRDKVANVTLITKGSVRWGPADDSWAIRVDAGDTNQNFPDLVGGVIYKVVPLTEDAEFLCITHRARTKFSATKFSLLAGTLMVGDMQSAVLVPRDEAPRYVEGPNIIPLVTGFGLILT